MFGTAILLALLTAVLLAIGFFLAGPLGMVVALVFAFAVNFFSYWYSDRVVLRLYGARRSLNKELNAMVGDMAREASIPKPKVYVIQSDVPNAFATGRNPNHSAIAITQGLGALSKDEMKGVIAHEIWHIKNRDTLIQTVAATIGGAIGFLAYMGYWSTIVGDRRDGSSLIGLVLIVIFAPLAALIVRMALSRRREYAADFNGAILCKKPRALASALRKISEVSKEKPMQASPSTSPLWIVNPIKQDWFTSLFSTHPPLSRRIAKLERVVVKRGGKA